LLSQFCKREGITRVVHVGEAGLPDFSGFNIPKRDKCTKRPQNIPKWHKIYQKAIKYTKSAIKYTKRPENWPNDHKIYQHLPLQDPPRFTQIGIFALKISHLAKLRRS
jgi:hypothetical protein